ncbi:TonB-linked outer membrane protein, SusC/RagA family [Flaviramulus basaltis]|uniref:TonB-linked outer membrane protein, SusC/RagA family n=1 Tax=Flaviramulus basaltis TaxID=369401 RepID=A0A1K2IAW2_9FLAO|nr:SusC/RagA family TonB-linked outer membrane protein [Flaviramulus basaltis]SFZ89529.1 TonB-linked outer membrane protein, SusC/RagA family [Flaviramulus basaltis]
MKNNSKCTLWCILYLMACSFTVDALPKIVSKLGIQQKTIQGVIVDTNGIPMAGVSIIVKGTQTGRVSDFNGTYTIPVNASDVLVFSFVGFKTLELPVAGRTQWNIQMEDDITALNTVEINAGYYKVKDKERTGNIGRISSKTIEKQPANNPLAAMQGHLAGVNIVQNTGVPGGGFNIDIRGQNFINGNTEPLYIIDGVPYGSQSLESNAVSSTINAGNVSPLNAINPNDIESIEVLKDADATAIYGSRAANGVVLITTKKGKIGQTKVSVNFTTTLGQVSNFLDLMSTSQYLEVRREGVENDGFGFLLDEPSFDFFWPDIKTWDPNRDTDWQKILLGGTSYRNTVQVSVSGGSETTQFLMSGGYQKETTVFPGESRYKKWTTHSQMNHQSKDMRFKINASTNYTYEDNLLPQRDFTNLAYLLPPNAPKLYDDEGNINWENNTWNNPLAALDEKYKAKTHLFLTNVGVSYNLLNNLEIKTNLGYTVYRLESLKTLPSSARSPRFGFTPENYSSINTNMASRQSWIVEPQLQWNQQWKDVDVNVLVGTTFQSQSSGQTVMRATGFPSDELLENRAAANTNEILQDEDSKYHYHALFGRVNVKYKDRYIINLTGRRDGSSRFGPDKQFGNFGALGLAWIFSEEALFNNNGLISFGKLRGSYGITGSDNIGDYRFLDTYSVTGNDYNGIAVLQPTGIFNPLFGWESNRKLELGLELGLFREKVFINTSWYQNRSSNQLIGIPLAATTGFNSLTGNFDATVENTGLEIVLKTHQVNGQNFQWTSSFNITIPKNKLVAFDGLESSTFANRYIIGQPLTINRLYHALGVDPDTGLYQFEDYNDDGNISSLGDKQWIEDFAPQFYGGLGNTLTYKGLTLDVFFQFKKQRAYNNMASMVAPGFSANGPVSLLDRWQEPGDTNPVMRAISGFDPSVFDVFEYQTESSAAVSDASFIRLRNISLTYKLPTSLSSGLDLSVYIQGQNLLTITNFEGPDPEQPSSAILPPLRQITLGIQCHF